MGLSSPWPTSTRWAPVARTRLGELACRFFEVVETDVLGRELDRPVADRPVAVTQQLVRWGPGDVPTVLSRAQEAHVRPFLARGDSGFVALEDGRPVGWIWLSRVTHRDPWSGLAIRLAPDEGYAYDLWTLPEARAAGTGAVLVAALLRAARDDGALSRVYGWVDSRNRQSQVVLRMLGFRDVQTVHRVHVLRRRGWMRRGSDAPPFGPLSARGRHSERL